MQGYIDYFKIGVKISGKIYGKPEIVGEIIAIDNDKDIVTVKWNNSIIPAKFYKKDLSSYLIK